MTSTIGATAVMATAVLATIPAYAQGGDTVRPAVGPPSTDEPQGMAEFGVGLLTLPGATVCVQRDAECAKGDSSIELTAWQLFRVTSRLAIGAGAGVGLTPTTDAPRNDPEGLTRDHTRRYLTMEGGLRWYPVVSKHFEAYIGTTGGLVVMSDKFETTTGQQTPVGKDGTTIRTEGFTLTGAVGIAYVVSPSFSVGGQARYGEWFLPSPPKTDVFGDEASLTGRTGFFDMTVNVAYRLAL